MYDEEESLHLFGVGTDTGASCQTGERAGRVATEYARQDSELILSTLDKGLHVLEVLASLDTPEGQNLTELSRILGMHRTTLLRILTTLQTRGFVTRDRTTDRYRIGMRVLSLSAAVLRNLDIRQTARPALQKLGTDTQELVLLTVLNEDEVVTVERFEGNRTISLRTELGERRPAYCTASGKAMLAYLPEDVVQRILARGLPMVTPRTITSRAAMQQHLAEIRERGFAWDDEERLEGVRCVAAPVFGHEGTVLAAVSVATFSLRTPWDRVRQIGECTRQTAGEISRLLGDDPGPRASSDHPDFAASTLVVSSPA